jgi:hypothetical protein
MPTVCVMHAALYHCFSFKHALAIHVQENENILVSSCGDGSIKVWDVAAPPTANPIRSMQEHTREVITQQL